MTKDLLKVIKNNCSFGKLDHNMPRGVTWESDKSHQCWADQTEERKEAEENLYWCLWRVIAFKCVLVFEAEAGLGLVVPFPLEASIATWEGLPNVISRNRQYPGVCSTVLNIKCSPLLQDFFF